MTASSGNKPSSLRAGPESQGGVSSEEALDGLGGAEIDCSSLGADGRAECETQEASAKASLRLSSLPQALSSHTDTSSASTLSLAAQVPVTAQGLVLGSLDLDDKAIPRHHVLSLLDSYIDTLRVAPIGLPAPGYISSGYGYRLSPFHGGPSMHQGIDFSLPQGSPIYATGDGIVQNVNRHGTYGIVVDIAHSSRVVTRYAHMSKALIREGEKICRGEVVGLVGSTGRSTAPHLHYEVRIDGRSKNPLPFMRLALDLKNLFQDLEEQAV
jgi:murein DD-endopeptidase MepM/ murein hydrolase activator NlpD